MGMAGSLFGEGLGTAPLHAQSAVDGLGVAGNVVAVVRCEKQCEAGYFARLPRAMLNAQASCRALRHNHCFSNEQSAAVAFARGVDCEKLRRTLMMESAGYAKTAPTRAEVDALEGATVLEFGTDWCGYCKGAQPHIAESLARAPQLRHVKIEDGPGRPLGRSFRVKLWPTLIFLRNGAEVARVVRPNDASDVDEGVAALA